MIGSLLLQWGRRINAAESYLRHDVDPDRAWKLQWGRRINAAERVRRVKRALGEEPASMGPPHQRGGEDPGTLTPMACRKSLQWGRRINAAESRS